MPLQGAGITPGCDGDLELAPPQDLTVNATSPSGAVASYPGGFVSDEDGTLPVQTCAPASGTTFPIGVSTVTCQVTDGDDATSTVTTTFHVIVNDTDLALTAMPADMAVNAAGPSGAAITYASPSAVDEDATTPGVRCSPASGSVFPIGTTTVTCTASDGDEAPATASFHISVNDTDLSLAGVPATITVDSSGPSGASVTYAPPSAVDEEAPTQAVVCDHASGSTFPIGTTTVVCVATDTDDSPSSVSAAFQVVVTDDDLGLSGVPGNLSTDATSSAGAAVAYAMPATVDEESGGASVSCDHAPGSTFPIGTTTVTCSAIDVDDLRDATATFTVTVNDTDLAVSVPANITVDSIATYGAPVTYPAPSALDEDGTGAAISCDHPSGSNFQIGTTVVTCTATDSDDSPSTASASFQVTVRDTDLYLGEVPADINAVATSASGTVVAWQLPVAFDEDGGLPQASCSPASGSTNFPVGTTTVTCQFTDPDDSPSTATASFHVIVVPDVRLATSVSPTAATNHTSVTTTASVTNIGASTEKVTVTYAVTYTDASGHTTTVANDKAVVTISAGQAATRTFSFAVKSSTASGTYAVIVSASDVTGTVTQTSRFTVS